MSESSWPLPLGVAVAMLTLALAIYFVALGVEYMISRNPSYSAIVICEDKNNYQALMQSTMWSYVLGGPHKVIVVEDPTATRRVGEILGLEVEGAATIILEDREYKHVSLGVVNSFNPSEVLRELREWPPSLIISGDRIRSLSQKEIESLKSLVRSLLEEASTTHS